MFFPLNRKKSRIYTRTLRKSESSQMLFGERRKQDSIYKPINNRYTYNIREICESTADAR